MDLENQGAMQAPWFFCAKKAQLFYNCCTAQDALWREVASDRLRNMAEAGIVFTAK
jgi:hypothetical protein